MATVLPQEEFVPWLDEFLPPVDDESFESLRTPIPFGRGDDALPEGGAVITNDSIRAALGAKSHLIGLAFTRAEALLRIAAALPQEDGRREAYAELATEHATVGFETMFDADYAGSHWIGSFAVKYLAYAAGVTN